MSYGAVIVRYDGLYHAKVHANGLVWFFGYSNFGYGYEELRKKVEEKLKVRLPDVKRLRFWDMMGDEICVVDKSRDRIDMCVSRDEYFGGWKPNC